MLIHHISKDLAFSTTTPLAANGVYTSPTIDTNNYKVTVGRSFSDVAGSYVFQFSDDGVTWDSGSSNATTANTIALLTTTNFTRYLRMVYTNGAAIQTVFRFSAYLSLL